MGWLAWRSCSVILVVYRRQELQVLLQPPWKRTPASISDDPEVSLGEEEARHTAAAAVRHAGPAAPDRLGTYPIPPTPTLLVFHRTQSNPHALYLLLKLAQRATQNNNAPGMARTGTAAAAVAALVSLGCIIASMDAGWYGEPVMMPIEQHQDPAPGQEARRRRRNAW